MGPLHALAPVRTEADRHGRWLTIVTCHQRLLIVADEFEAEKPSAYTLCLKSVARLEAAGQHFLTRDEEGPLSVQPLGEYEVEATPNLLLFHQRLARSRFLVAVTRDVNARVRALNGWAVEQRTDDEILLLLHANRAQHLRPLGPIHTDARFAAVRRSQGNNLASLPSSWDVHLLQASQLIWPNEGKLQATAPFDLTMRLPEPANSL